MKKITATGGHVLVRRSRWLPILHDINVSRRSRLWNYATDGNGYREWQNGFDPDTGLCVDYFVWNGKKWAIDQFYSVYGTMGIMPIIWTEHGEEHHIIGYDSEDYYNPILIELDECGEHVRVYEEER